MEKVHTSVGRRKKSVARIRLSHGKGTIIVNGKKLEEYFSRSIHHLIIKSPLAVTDHLSNYDIHVNVTGGGETGQAGAIRHGISRALTLADPKSRSSLKKNGMLTRDPRMTERKKYGHKGARKSFQFSKR